MKRGLLCAGALAAVLCSSCAFPFTSGEAAEAVEGQAGVLESDIEVAKAVMKAFAREGRDHNSEPEAEALEIPNPEEDDLCVVIYENGWADFIIEDAYIAPGSGGYCGVEFELPRGRYTVSLRDGGEDRQCSLWEHEQENPNQSHWVEDCSYGYNGTQLTLSLELKKFGMENDFGNITEYILENGSVSGTYYPLAIAAEKIVRGGGRKS